MTPEQFAQWGEALYGPQWRRPLARKLIPPKRGKPISERMVRAWLHPDPQLRRPFPAWLYPRMVELLDAHRMLMHRLCDEAGCPPWD